MTRTEAQRLLGVQPEASQKDIRSAYRKLASAYHPDRHQGNPLEDLARDRMRQVNEAYAVLTGPEARSTCSYESSREASSGGASYTKRGASGDYFWDASRSSGGVPVEWSSAIALARRVAFAVAVLAIGARFGGLLLRGAVGLWSLVRTVPVLATLAAIAVLTMAWRRLRTR